MYWLLFWPWPFALASTCSSVEKLSTPEAGLPDVLVPKPETPGAIVTSVTRLRPTIGNSATPLLSSVSWVRLSAVSTIGASVVTVTESTRIQHGAKLED